MKVVQAYSPTSSHDAQVESFYEDPELEMIKIKTRYTILMVDFNTKVNTKVGKNQGGDQAVGGYGINTINARGEILVEFTKRDNLRIIQLNLRTNPRAMERKMIGLILEDKRRVYQGQTGVKDIMVKIKKKKW